VDITLQRQDGKPFFMEDKADYDPDLDSRPVILVRIDATDRSYMSDDIRVDE
jgi:hypothetical protein